MDNNRKKCGSCDHACDSGKHCIAGACQRFCTNAVAEPCCAEDEPVCGLVCCANDEICCDGEWNVLTQSIPYVITLIVVVGVIGRSIPPASVGRPYVKQ